MGKPILISLAMILGSRVNRIEPACIDDKILGAKHHWRLKLNREN